MVGCSFAEFKFIVFQTNYITRFNILGQVGVLSGVAFGLAQIIETLMVLKSDYISTPSRRLGIIAIIITSWLLVNSFGRKFLRYFLYAAISLNSLGVLSFGIAVLVRAPTHQTASFVFGTFIDKTGLDLNTGWSFRASPAYVACCGSLLAQFALIGCDSSAHLAEETVRASWNAPIGLITSVLSCALLGLFFILSMLFSIQDFDKVLQADQPVIEIVVSLFGKDGTIILFMILLSCGWNSGLFTMTSNSRLIFAFSRDKALVRLDPNSKILILAANIEKPYYFSKVNTSLMGPVRAVSLSALLSFCLALPSLGSDIAFSAVTSIGTIGLLISYGIPILIGCIYHQRFEKIKGPFQLGTGSRPVAIIALLYIGFVTIILLLPTQTPVTSCTFNYSVVAVSVVLVFAVGSWVIMRKFFEGPIQFNSNELLKER
jgi:amino acid transporter